MRRTTSIGSLIAALAAACASEDAPSDTTRVHYVVDTAARDTAPPPPPSRIGQMALLSGVPPGGLCSERRYPARTDAARQITYQSTSPRRLITLAVGHPNRAFELVSLQVMGTQTRAGVDETESIAIAFSASGSVTSGSRQYHATGAETINDRQALSPGDSADAVRLARDLLSLCAASSR